MSAAHHLSSCRCSRADCICDSSTAPPQALRCPPAAGAHAAHLLAQPQALHQRELNAAGRLLVRQRGGGCQAGCPPHRAERRRAALEGGCAAGRHSGRRHLRAAVAARRRGGEVRDAGAPLTCICDSIDSAVQIRGTQGLTLALQRLLAAGCATEAHCLRCKVGHRDRRSVQGSDGRRVGRWAPVEARRDLPELQRGAVHPGQSPMSCQTCRDAWARGK